MSALAQLPSPLSVQTHHKFRKMLSFLCKKVRTSASEELPLTIVRPGQSSLPPWLRTSYMDGPLCVSWRHSTWYLHNTNEAISCFQITSSRLFWTQIISTSCAIASYSAQRALVTQSKKCWQPTKANSNRAIHVRCWQKRVCIMTNFPFTKEI